jgi:hypothetical protein
MAGHYLPALINGDYSGLSDTEQDELDSWFKEYKDSGAIYTFNVSDDTEYAEDCVTGLMSDCYKLQVFEV